MPTRLTSIPRSPPRTASNPTEAHVGSHRGSANARRMDVFRARHGADRRSHAFAWSCVHRMRWIRGLRPTHVPSVSFSVTSSLELSTDPSTSLVSAPPSLLFERFSSIGPLVPCFTSPPRPRCRSTHACVDVAFAATPRSSRTVVREFRDEISHVDHPSGSRKGPTPSIDRNDPSL